MTMLHYDIKSNLFSAELVENIATKEGQSSADFGYASGIRLADEVARTFSMARNQWGNFLQTKERIPERDSAVSETRAHWMIPFLSFLGYELNFVRSEAVDGAAFTISHRDSGKGGFPVHISGFRQSLDKNPHLERGNRQSPQVQMQEYLNHTEHLYGIITNGHQIRLLRDHHRLTGVQYMEWDLEQMMESGDLASFNLLFRMLHSSRVPEKMGDDCLLEVYHRESVEEGHRVRDKLKKAVAECLKTLGNGFLLHPTNAALRGSIECEHLSAVAYGQMIRQLVYRLLFLLVAEDRKLVFDHDATARQQLLYREHYSLARLRTLAERHFTASEHHTDVWEQLKTTFRFFEEKTTGSPLGISPLSGELFHPNTLKHLKNAHISNRMCLHVIDLLSRFEKEKGQRIRINYTRINVEEFGAVYESLLDLNPEIDLAHRTQPFRYVSGASRKTTGSYYTHDDLVKQLLKTALRPVMEDRLKAAEALEGTYHERKQRMEHALLNIKVCDPACGSGHFLLGTARALAAELAHLRADDGESTRDYEPQALRDVIERCIYGVDLNPDAVELCRLVLWIEAHVPGRPMTYLNHKIKCGNSLVGWFGGKEAPIIPDGAYKPVTGDDKAIARALKQQNTEERKGVMRLEFDLVAEQPHNDQTTRSFRSMDALPGNSLDELWQKQRAHESWETSEDVRHQRLLFDAWTYAFFQPFTAESPAQVTQAFIEQIASKRIDPNHEVLAFIRHEARKLGFFHWKLEFPDVFHREESLQGFDVLLGNPPWERIKLQEKEFFESRSTAIAEASNAARRKERIAALPRDGQLFQDFQLEKRKADGLGRFLRGSENYEYTASGDINTYSVFSERALKLIAPLGRSGTIVPTGIATDYTNRHFFAHIVDEGKLVSLFDFENKKGLFHQITSLLRFSLLTFSNREGSRDYEIYAGFFLQEISDLSNQIKIRANDMMLFNPNTLTCPLFRTQLDYDLLAKVYRTWPVFLGGDNEWKISFKTMFHMANDSNLFRTRNLSEIKNGSASNERFINDKKANQVSLYEAKNIWQYNHRYSSYGLVGRQKDKLKPHYNIESTLKNPELLSIPRYFVESKLVREWVDKYSPIHQDWFFGFRDTTSSGNERTFVCSVIPLLAVNHKLPLIFSDTSVPLKCTLISMLSSLIFDFFSKQKISGMSMTYFHVKQLPIIPPEDFSSIDFQFIVPRVLELTYTAWDLKAFADDVWEEADAELRALIEARWQENQQAIAGEPAAYPEWVERKKGEFPHPPFRWDSEHRHVIQSELDAYSFWKYGLEEEEIKYVLDPTTSALAGETQEERDRFPGETFRVLKEKEIRKYSEFRTWKLVMQAWKERPWQDPAQTSERKAQRNQKRDYKKAENMPHVMAYIIQRHQEKPRFLKTLGRTKMEKLLHGIEATCDIDLGRAPIRDDFGPADFELLTQAERNASELNYFEAYKESLDGTTPDPQKDYRVRYRKSEAFTEALNSFHQNFQEKQENIDRFIDLFLNASSKEAELRMTVFAAWNNLLIAGEIIKNDEIILTESHEWSPAKKAKFHRNDFIEPLQWLRANRLVPKGQGKEVK